MSFTITISTVPSVLVESVPFTVIAEVTPTPDAQQIPAIRFSIDYVPQLPDVDVIGSAAQLPAVLTSGLHRIGGALSLDGFDSGDYGFYDVDVAQLGPGPAPPPPPAIQDVTGQSFDTTNGTPETIDAVAASSAYRPNDASDVIDPYTTAPGVDPYTGQPPVNPFTNEPIPSSDNGFGDLIRSMYSQPVATDDVPQSVRDLIYNWFGQESAGGTEFSYISGEIGAPDWGSNIYGAEQLPGMSVDEYLSSIFNPLAHLAEGTLEGLADVASTSIGAIQGVGEAISDVGAQLGRDINETLKPLQPVFAGLQIADGARQAVGGLFIAGVTAETGVGAAAGLAIMANGLDNMRVGVERLLGENAETVIYQLAHDLTCSLSDNETLSRIVGTVADLAANAAGGAAAEGALRELGTMLSSAAFSTEFAGETSRAFITGAMRQVESDAAELETLTQRAASPSLEEAAAIQRLEPTAVNSAGRVLTDLGGVSAEVPRIESDWLAELEKSAFGAGGGGGGTTPLELSQRIADEPGLAGVPGGFLDRGVFGRTERPAFLVRVGEYGQPGRYGVLLEPPTGSPTEAALYAMDLAQLGEEALRDMFGLPPTWLTGAPGNTVKYVNVFQVPAGTPYINGVAGPQLAGGFEGFGVFPGGAPQAAIPRVELEPIVSFPVQSLPQH
jgi:hypothetical protein